MSVLRFIFESFWHFAGAMFLMCVVLGGIADIVRAFRK